MVLIWVELTRGTPKIGTNLEKLTREGADIVGVNLGRANQRDPKNWNQSGKTNQRRSRHSWC